MLVVVVDGTIRVSATEVVNKPDVPVTVTSVLLPSALFETAMVSTELVLPPAESITGFLLNPPETPDGNAGTARITGEPNPPIDWTVTVTASAPPGFMLRLSRLSDSVNEGPVAGVVAVAVVAVLVPVVVVTGVLALVVVGVTVNVPYAVSLDGLPVTVIM